MKATWVGHSTVLVELDGTRILTDPLLVGSVAGLRRRPAPVDSSVLTGIDAVLISHLHRDHLDLRSLRRLSGLPPLIVPGGAGELLREQGFGEVTELAIGDRIRIGSLSVRATPAEHRATRNPLGAETPCLGFLIDGSRRALFFGDTDIFDGMEQLGGGLDLALLPVWGWGPKVGPGHLNPERAAQALKLLRPRVAIPIHWGTYAPLFRFWRSSDFLTRPGHEFAALAAQVAPEVEIDLLVPGETVIV